MRNGLSQRVGCNAGVPALLVMLALTAQTSGQAPPSPPASPQAVEELDVAERTRQIQARDALSARARAERARGEFVAAASTIEEEMRIERRVFGEPHMQLAGSLDLLATVLEEAEHFETARDRRLEHVAMLAALNQPDWLLASARARLEDIQALVALPLADQERLAVAQEQKPAPPTPGTTSKESAIHRGGRP